jgi:hypothetical protein
MTVRPFDWRDLPALYRQRNRSVFLDSALVLTRGPMLLPGALLSYLVPTMGVFTCVNDGDEANEEEIIGQFIHVLGSQFAQLTFLTPDVLLDSPALVSLIEYMVLLSGERGAMRLLADVDEKTFAFEALRKIGFAIYARQRIWQLSVTESEVYHPEGWRSATRNDMIAIRSLYNNIVPGLVHQVEPFVKQRPKGLVYYHQGELLAYVELKYGHRGIWATPFVHPDAENLLYNFALLLKSIPGRRSRPVYLCVRSYQAWFEATIEDLGAKVGPRQAVMVKHLTAQQKVLRTLTLPALDGGQPEVTAPIVQSGSK